MRANFTLIGGPDIQEKGVDEIFSDVILSDESAGVVDAVGDRARVRVVQARVRVRPTRHYGLINETVQRS